jgi:hypothetical protein
MEDSDTFQGYLNIVDIKMISPKDHLHFLLLPVKSIKFTSTSILKIEE